MGSYCVVIKVKFGESLRPFDAQIHRDEFCFNLSMLNEKIRDLFGIKPEVDFTLTYIDEDGDSVTLFDEHDLHEAAAQSLDPLRITVSLNSGSDVSEKASSIGEDNQLQCRAIGSGTDELLKSAQESLRDEVWKLLFDSSAKPSASESCLPKLVELVEQITARLEKLSEPRAGPSSCTTVGAPDVQQGPVNGEGLEHRNLQPTSSRGSKHFQNLMDGVLDRKETAADLERMRDLEEGFGVHTKPVGFGGSNPDYVKHCLQDSDFQRLKRDKKQPLMYSSCVSTIPPFKASYNDANNSRSTFHTGGICAGCGVDLISVPRFKSRTMYGYDLCSICFERMGHDADYIKIDPLLTSSNRVPLKGFYDHLLDSRCVHDVKVLGGSTMAPSSKFRKTWSMRNTGNMVWPRGTRLMWIGGTRLADTNYVRLEIPDDGFPVGYEYDIAVDFTAPVCPNQYVSYWRMASPSGEQFGDYISVFIEVDVPLKNSCDASTDLNLPPVDNLSKDLEHVNPQSNQDSVLLKNQMLELMESEDIFFDAEPRKGQASNQDQEHTLLSELAEMGFENSELNREILRKNEYNFEKSVHDLCAVVEWDLILDELQELGFSDKETNRQLLRKNNESISCAFAELINREA